MQTQTDDHADSRVETGTDTFTRTRTPDEILGKWRNAISLTESADGRIHLTRFDKISGLWKRIAFFQTVEDLEDFHTWMADLMDQNWPEEVGESEG